MILLLPIVLYIVIYLAVKHGINHSQIGLYYKNKQQTIEVAEISNEEIKKEFEQFPNKPQY